MLAVLEMSLCFADARDDPQVGVIILTGERSPGKVACPIHNIHFQIPVLVQKKENELLLPDPGEGPLAFCSGGDQSVRGQGGYVGEDEIPRLNVLDLQVWDFGKEVTRISTGIKQASKKAIFQYFNDISSTVPVTDNVNQLNSLN